MSEYGGTTVDERVVEMRIDNDKFEAGAKKTISILESLDKSLNNLGNQNASGFEDVAKTMDAVTSKFSIMGTIGDQVLRNLTNSAMGFVNEMKHVAESLTTRQIDAGWSKYADKTSAIQTIMAATHKDIGTLYKDEADQLERVNEQIEKLAWFTDETSYNFIDMVGNIGKFTSNGRGLEESVTAMQGISNWAAISGGKVQEASRAMYNLSQALGMGYVSIADWKSIELANMATAEFKEMVLETATDMGKLQKVAENTWKIVGTGDADDAMSGTLMSVEDFREGLKKKWFDSDVLLEVLQRYGTFTDALYNATQDLGGVTASEFLEALEAYKSNNMEKIGNLARRMGVDVQELIPHLQELSKAEYDLGYRAFVAAQEAKTFQEAIDATKDAVSTKWMDIFEILFGNYNEAKKLWTGLANTLYDVFATPVEKLGDFLSAVFDDTIFDTDENDDAVEGAEALGKQTESLAGMLEKAGRSSNDLFDAIKKVLSAEELQELENQGYKDLEQILKDGKISADQFRQALELMAQDTSHVVEGTEIAGKSFEEMRKVATEVLRGDWGNGEQRRKLLEEAGFDYETIQWLAGNLNWFGTAVSDEFLMALDKPARVAEILTGRIGGSTAQAVQYTAEEIAAMNDMLQNCGVLLDQIENGTMDVYTAYSILSGKSQSDLTKYMTVGDMFRQGLKNILTYITDIATIAADAFEGIFFGKDAIRSFKDVVANFYLFSEAIQITDKETGELTESGEKLQRRFESIFIIVKQLGRVIKAVFTIAKTAIKSAFYVLSPFLELFGNVFDMFADLVSNAEDNFTLSGIENFFRGLGEGIRNFLNSFPIIEMAFMAIGNAISFVAGLISSIFGPSVDEAGVAVDNFAGSVENVTQVAGASKAFGSLNDSFSSFLEKHTLLKAFVNTIQNVFNFISSHIGVVFDILKIAGIGIVAVIDTILVAISNVFGWFGDGTTEATKLGGGIDALRKRFVRFEEIISKLSADISTAFKSGGIQAAVSKFFDSLQKGFRTIIPDGNVFTTVLSGIWNFLKNGLGTVASFLIAPIVGLSDAIGILWSNMGGKEAEENVENAENIFTRFGKAVEALFSVIFSKPPEIKQKVINFLTPIWEGVVEFARSIKFRDVLSALRLAVITSFLGDILDFVHVFRHVRNEVDDIMESLTETIFDMGYMFRKMGTSFQANAVLKFAVAVAILGIVIYNLTKLAQSDARDDMTYVTTLLMSLMLVMTALLGVINKSNYLSRVDIKQFTVIPRLMGALIGLALVIFATANAISKINKIGDWKKIWAAFAPILTVVALLMVGIIALASIISKAGDITETGSKFRAIGSSVMRIAGGMVFMALAIQMLLVPIALFTLLFRGENGTAGLGMAAAVVGGVLAALFAVMLVMAKTLGKMENAFYDERILAVGTSILKMAAAMFVLAFAVDMLLVPIAILAAISAIGEGRGALALLGGLILVGLLLAAIGMFFKSLTIQLGALQAKKIENIGNVFLKMAASMLMVALAINMMIVPIIILTGLANKYGDEIWKAVGVVGAIMLVYGAILAGLMWISNNAKSAKRIEHFGDFLIKLSLSMLIFSAAGVVFGAALVVIAAGLAAISGVIPKIQDFGKTLLTIAVIAGAMWLFGAAAKSIGSGLLAMAAAFLVFAAGLYVLGHAMDAFAKWYPKFKEKIKSLITGFKERLKSGDWKSFAVILAGFTGLVLALKLLINMTRSTNRLFNFFDTFGSKTKSFGSNILGWIGTIPTKLIALLGKIATAFTTHREEVVKAIVGLLIVVGAYIIDIIPTVTDMVVKAVIELLKSVAKSINDHSGEIVEAITDIVAAIFNLIAEVFAGIGKLWDKLSTGGKWAFGAAAIVTIAAVIYKLIAGIKNLKEHFRGIADSTKEISKNGDKVIEVAREVAKAGGGSGWYAPGYNSSVLGNMAGDALSSAIIGKTIARNLAKGAAIGGEAGAKVGAKGLLGTILANPIVAAILGTAAIVGGSAYLGYRGVQKQNEFLKDQQYGAKGRDKDDLQDRIAAVNDLKESYEKAADEFNTLSETAPDTLFMPQQEMDAKKIAWHEELEELKKEFDYRTYADFNNELSRYIILADANKDATDKLTKAYAEFDNALKEAGASKEDFDRINKYSTSVDTTLDNMFNGGLIKDYSSLQMLKQYAQELTNLEGGVNRLNGYYNTLAEMLQIPVDEFMRQYEAVNGNIYAMDAYKNRVQNYAQEISIAADGTVALTEAGLQLAAAYREMRGASATAEEQIEDINAIAGLSGFKIREDLLGNFNLSREDLLNKIKEVITPSGTDFEKLGDIFEPTGSFIDGAVGDSIEDYAYLTEGPMKFLADMTEEYFRYPKAFDVNSPSKRFAKLGESIPEGVALGIQNGTKKQFGNGGVFSLMASLIQGSGRSILGGLNLYNWLPFNIYGMQIKTQANKAEMKRWDKVLKAQETMVQIQEEVAVNQAKTQDKMFEKWDEVIKGQSTSSSNTKSGVTASAPDNSQKVSSGNVANNRQYYTVDETNKIIEETQKQTAQTEKEIVAMYTEHEIDAEEAAKRLHETWYNDMSTAMDARANTEQPIKKNENENIYIRSEDLADWMDSQRKEYLKIMADKYDVGPGSNRRLWNGGDYEDNDRINSILDAIDQYTNDRVEESKRSLKVYDDEALAAGYITKEDYDFINKWFRDPKEIETITAEWEKMFDSAGDAKERLKILNDELIKIKGAPLVDDKAFITMTEEEAQKELTRFINTYDNYSEYSSESHMLMNTLYDVFRNTNKYLDRLQKLMGGDRGNAKTRHMGYDLLDYMAKPEMTPELYEKYYGWLYDLNKSHPFYRSDGVGSFNNGGFDDVVLVDSAIKQIEEAIQQTEKYRAEVQQARDWLKQNADALNLNIETDIDPISDIQILSWKSSMGEKALSYGIWDFMKLTPDELMKQMGLTDTTELTEKLTSAFSVFGVPIDGAVGGSIEENKGLIYNPMHDVFAGDLPLWFRDLLEINSPSKVFSDLAVGIPEGVAEGIQSAEGQNSIMTALQNMVMAMTSNLTNLPNIFRVFGINAVSGLLSGLSGGYSAAYAAGASLGAAVTAGFRNSLQIRSPSRVFMELAEFIPKGIAQGIENEEDSAIESIVVLSKDLIDAVHKNMAKVGVLADDNFTVNPSIRPVMDYSGLAGRSNYAAVMANSAKTAEYLKNIGNIDKFDHDTANITFDNQNKDVVEELKIMSTRLGKLGQEITNMKIVLNNGVLVGELAPAMNRQLGTYATRELRQ